MSARTVGLVAGMLLLTAGAVSAQLRVTARAQTVVESYTFDPGLLYTGVIETAVPVGIDLSFGRRVDVTLSTGYVSLDLSPDSAYVWVSGMLDTQARIGINLIPGRLIAVINGALPTGTKVDQSQAAVLAPIASDVIGFAIPTLGSGASFGGGFVGALPVGKFALGVGATYSYPFSYKPFKNSATELEPGKEFRARLGLEGPVARTTYVRFAGVVAARGKDVFADSLQPGVGARYIGYAELVQGIGRMQLTVYGFDVYRGAPALEGTALGPAILPKGNLLAAGFRHAIPVTRTLSVAPRAEWRLATTADTTSGSRLLKAGQSLRVGMDVRQAFSPGVVGALFGSGFFGNVRPAGSVVNIPVTGWRAGVLFSVTR